MPKNNNLTDFVTDLADAIRAKCGTTGTINPQVFSKFVGGMPFFKQVKSRDYTGPASDPKSFYVMTETGYQKAVIYLTNDNGETSFSGGGAFVQLDESGNVKDIGSLHSTDERITISGFPYISDSLYKCYFEDNSGGKNLISSGWHIKVDFFDLYMGNPDGENTKMNLNNATGGGV